MIVKQWEHIASRRISQKNRARRVVNLRSLNVYENDVSIFWFRAIHATREISRATSHTLLHFLRDAVSENRWRTF